jgi:hypothetical protein
MSVGTKLLQAAAGNAGEAVYVEDVFATHLYDGESSTSTTITINNGLDLSDKGGLLWTKSRGGAYSHYLIDSERGHGTGAILYSNLTNAATNSSFSTAFTSTGYTMKGGYDGFSQSSTSYGSPYVSWAFAKQEKFFDIVTYTGTGSAQNISHNLGSVPGAIIIKRTSATEDWLVYHRSTGNEAGTGLNETAATYTGVTAYWNSTTPTDSVFTVGTHDRVNTSSETYIAYLFAHDEQEFGENSDEAIIKCGGYSGNSQGSATTDQTITLGFEPQWIMIKKSSGGAGSWAMFDNMRGVVADGADRELRANSDVAEQTTDENLRFEADGFTLEGANLNYTDGTTAHQYIYMAIRRPNKPASEFAATALFTPLAYTTTDGSWQDRVLESNFTTDLAINGYRNIADGGTSSFVDRPRGYDQVIRSHQTNAESQRTSDYSPWPQTGQAVTSNEWSKYNGGSGLNYYNYQFRRASGFFDIVTYAGTGSARTLTHNLGVVPEFMVAKSRTESQPWVTYDAANGATKYARLESQNAVATYSGIWNDTAPTSSVFSTGGDAYINKSGQSYIIYLFATVAGISKVGSYTGTGSDLNVDCGFSAGARFVLIKRTDSTGDWYVYDSARGIVAGNDPYVLLNTTDAEVTNTDYIDPLSSGFTITSSAPAGLNASSGTYIFLAIA